MGIIFLNNKGIVFRKVETLMEVRNINEIKKHFDRDKFFIKLSPINPNATSNKNNLGKGVVDGVNLI